MSDLIRSLGQLTFLIPTYPVAQSLVVDILPSLSRWLPLTRKGSGFLLQGAHVRSLDPNIFRGRENVGGGIDVAVVECTALHTLPFPYS